MTKRAHKSREGRCGMANLTDHVACSRFSVRVLGGFTVTDDAEPVRLPPGAQRLVAWLVTHPRGHPRPTIAAQLWPDLAAARSTAAMRSALWHLRQGAPCVVQDVSAGVQLGAEVRVDLWNAIALAKVHYDGSMTDGDCAHGWAQRADDFADDLLPDWPDEWLVLQRERHRQVRLHALERLGRALLDAHRPEEAVEVALLAVGGDPLRESAQRILIEAHLAQKATCPRRCGNTALTRACCDPRSA